ncbi:hypothetical protein ACEW7V_00920 [Areca yellow leaf disease phytoplasma]|uniref:hypothetical protein n=1 Tax=Areca yellow leaf disease phytoplasma TaxID=927614 RepID=UPI0035B4FE65
MVRETEKINVEDWEELEEIIFSTIKICLDKSSFAKGLYRDYDKGSLAEIENTYMGKNMINKLWLKKQLYSLRMPEGGDLVAHIQRFNQVCSEVMSLDVKIDEEDRALLLLCSLPGSYDGLITTLVYGKKS